MTTIECVCCQRHGPHAGRGLVRVCYERHKRRGTLTDWQRTMPSMVVQISEATFLLGSGLSTEEIWPRLGYANRRSFLESMRQAARRGLLAEEERAKWAMS